MELTSTYKAPQLHPEPISFTFLLSESELHLLHCVEKHCDSFIVLHFGKSIREALESDIRLTPTGEQAHLHIADIAWMVDIIGNSGTESSPDVIKKNKPVKQCNCIHQGRLPAISRKTKCRTWS